jgi:hypothetical protein
MADEQMPLVNVAGRVTATRRRARLLHAVKRGLGPMTSIIVGAEREEPEWCAKCAFSVVVVERAESATGRSSLDEHRSARSATAAAVRAACRARDCVGWCALVSVRNRLGARSRRCRRTGGAKRVTSWAGDPAVRQDGVLLAGGVVTAGDDPAARAGGRGSVLVASSPDRRRPQSRP